ncbi:MAG: hypothetical protein AAGJ94_14940, partial [Pseudomonadota bacterium]
SWALFNQRLDLATPGNPQDTDNENTGCNQSESGAHRCEGPARNRPAKAYGPPSHRCTPEPLAQWLRLQKVPQHAAGVTEDGKQSVNILGIVATLLLVSEPNQRQLGYLPIAFPFDAPFARSSMPTPSRCLCRAGFGLRGERVRVIIRRC